MQGLDMYKMSTNSDRLTRQNSIVQVAVMILSMSPVKTFNKLALYVLDFVGEMRKGKL